MTVNIVFLVSEIIVGVVIVIGNAFVLLGFLADRQLRSQLHYRYIFSLSVADALVGVVGMPTYIWSFLTAEPGNFEACLVINTWILMLCSISIYSLTCVSIDRLVAIVYPLRYPSTITPRTTLIMIVLAWTVGGFIGLLPLMGWNLGRPPEPRCIFSEVMNFEYLVFHAFAVIYVPLLVIAVIYIKIFWEFRKQLFRIAAMAHQTADQTKDTRKAGVTRLRRQQIRGARALLLVIVVFAACFVPLYVINCIMFFSPTTPIPLDVILVSIVLTHVNSAVNPVLYAAGMKEIRRAMRKVLCWPCKRGDDRGDMLGGTDASVTGY